jgi:hypothetical protein
MRCDARLRATHRSHNRPEQRRTSAGARILITLLLHEMVKRDAKRGLAALFKAYEVDVTDFDCCKHAVEKITRKYEIFPQIPMNRLGLPEAEKREVVHWKQSLT